MHYERLLCLPATAANPATQAVVFIWERKKLACLAATYLVLGYALFSLFCLFSGARRKTILCHFKLTEKQEWYKEMCLVTQSCLTVCDPMDWSPPGSSVHGDSPGKNTGVDCHALLQGIFPTQGLNTGLSHCRRVLYCLSCQGSP